MSDQQDAIHAKVLCYFDILLSRGRNSSKWRPAWVLCDELTAAALVIGRLSTTSMLLCILKNSYNAYVGLFYALPSLSDLFLMFAGSQLIVLHSTAQHVLLVCYIVTYNFSATAE